MAQGAGQGRSTKSGSKRAPDLPIKSPGELVTLASIVEKETGKVDERPRVAGVFVNRLQKHMKLQSDPTIVYGLVFGKGTLGHPITKAELDQATPYNTYNHRRPAAGADLQSRQGGARGGRQSAATKDLYFVADGTGGHAFAETLDQHLKNVAHWRQIEKDAKDRLAPDAARRRRRRPRSSRPSTARSIPTDPKAFGGAPCATLRRPCGSAAAPLAARLAQARPKAASSRRRCSARAGRLSRGKIAGKSIEDLGAVVTGVNDEPRRRGHSRRSGGPDAAPGPATWAVPCRPPLADQKAREARYGDGAPSPTRRRAATARQPSAVDRAPRAFDASEGTPLDPLLNKTYDLSYAKDVSRRLEVAAGLRRRGRGFPARAPARSRRRWKR